MLNQALNTIYNCDENECFACLTELWTTKPCKKVNKIYLATAACNSDHYFSNMSALQTFLKSKCWYRWIPWGNNCRKSLFSQIVVSFKEISCWTFRRTDLFSLHILLALSLSFTCNRVALKDKFPFSLVCCSTTEAFVLFPSTWMLFVFNKVAIFTRCNSVF